MNPTRLPWTWQELKRSVHILSGGFWGPDRGPYRHTPLWGSAHPSCPLSLITGPMRSCPLPICPLGAPTPCSEDPLWADSGCAWWVLQDTISPLTGSQWVLEEKNRTGRNKVQKGAQTDSETSLRFIGVNGEGAALVDGVGLGTELRVSLGTLDFSQDCAVQNRTLHPCETGIRRTYSTYYIRSPYEINRHCF